MTFRERVLTFLDRLKLRIYRKIQRLQQKICIHEGAERKEDANGTYFFCRRCLLFKEFE